MTEQRKYRDSAFGRDALIADLRQLDALLTEPVKLVVIGGSAGLLQYNSVVATCDIDAYNQVDATVLALAKEHGIPLAAATVAELPYNYEDRLIRWDDQSLRNLQIIFPEIHDWIISKCARGQPHDLEMVTQESVRTQLSLATLVERYAEMKYVNSGTQDELFYGLLAAIERIWGKRNADETAARLQAIRTK